MNIADEIKKLQELHAGGALTDAEFARAKQAVINGVSAQRENINDFVGGEPSNGSDEGLVENIFAGRKETLGEAANRYVSFQVIAGIVGLIIALIFFFGFFLPQWNRMDSRMDRQLDHFNSTQDKMMKDFNEKFDSFPGHP